MIPLSDGIPARRFPFINVALIVANFAVWILYELPHLNSSVLHASFYPCAVDGSCHGPEPWGVSWFTAMFMHGSWSHILGNMLFLAIFGKNVEDFAAGELRWLRPDGQPMEAADWSDAGARAVAVGGADGLLLVNAWWEPLSFRLPDDRTWAVELDTADPTVGRLASGTIELAGRSLVLAGAQAST